MGYSMDKYLKEIQKFEAVHGRVKYTQRLAEEYGWNKRCQYDYKIE